MMEGRIEVWKPDDSLRYAAERVDIGVGGWTRGGVCHATDH